MTKRRKSVITVTVLALITLLLVSLTIAYLTDRRATLNTLGIGTDGSDPDKRTVKIKLTEDGFAAMPGATKTAMNPGEPDEYSKVTVGNIVPNQKVNKDPKVTNIGADDVYVRIWLKDASGNVITNLDSYLKPATAAKGIFGVMTEETGLGIDTSKWFQGQDGAWYYSTDNGATSAKMAPNAAVAFFRSKTVGSETYTMCIPWNMDNNDMEQYKGIVNLQIDAEAIQARAFTPGNLASASTPWADPSGTTVPIIPAIRP